MLRRAARVVNISRRTFGADHGHHHHGPHVPEFYDRLAYSCLTVCFLWIMYRAKENKGQLLGLYQPWLHEHEHVHHHFEESDPFGATVPTLVEHDDDEEHDDHHDEDDE